MPLSPGSPRGHPHTHTHGFAQSPDPVRVERCHLAEVPFVVEVSVKVLITNGLRGCFFTAELTREEIAWLTVYRLSMRRNQEMIGKLGQEIME
jgi:hypothetical protein